MTTIYLICSVSAGWIENPLSAIVLPESAFGAGDEKWMNDSDGSGVQWWNRISLGRGLDKYSKIVTNLPHECRYIPWSKTELQALVKSTSVTRRHRELFQLLLHVVTTKTCTHYGPTDVSERSALRSLWFKACQVADMDFQSESEDEIQRALENLIPDRHYPGLKRPFRCVHLRLSVLF